MALRAGDPIEVESAAPARSNGGRSRVAGRATRVTDLQRENAELQRTNDRLERANGELWRENARLARGTLGQSDAAAAAQLRRSERELGPQLGDAEATIERLERLLATPRHQAVERLREAVMRSGPLYWVVRRLWRLARPGA